MIVLVLYTETKHVSTLNLIYLLRLLQQHGPQTLQTAIHSLPSTFLHLRFHQLEARRGLTQVWGSHLNILTFSSL